MTCPQHTWGPTTRIDRPMASLADTPYYRAAYWHWCRCTVCGADGFKVQKDDGTVSQATRCWQPCDTVEIL